MADTLSQARIAASRRPPRGGFALLMSLMLLVLCTVLLVGLARFSLSLSAECRDAREEMQWRWGAVSLRAAIASRADQVIARRVGEGHAGLNREDAYSVVETVQLGEVSFRLRVEDENRKLNLNRLFVTGGSDDVSEALRLLGQGRTAVRLRPKRGRQRGTARPFESWGQVYALDELPRREHPALWLIAETGSVTCWGNGRVHYSRSSDQVLQFVAQRAAGPVTARRLLTQRSENPQLGMEELLNRLAVNRSKRNRLRGWLTDQSQCFSLWIAAEGSQRTSYDLLVTEVTASESLRSYRFLW